MNTPTPHAERRGKISAEELRAAMQWAASAVANENLAPDLPPLAWSWKRERLDGMAANEAAARQWAQRFGLADESSVSWGVREFVGTMDGAAVRVWYIDDRDAFQRGHR